MTEHRVLLDLRDDPIIALMDIESQAAYVNQKLVDIVTDNGKTKHPWNWGDKMIVKAYMPSVVHAVLVTVHFDYGNITYTREEITDEGV